MSFVDFNTTYVGGATGPEYFKYFSPFIGVVFGFGLSQGVEYFRRRNKRNKIGKQYSFHYDIIKNTLRVNIENFKTYIHNYENDILNDVGFAYNYASFEIVNSIDVYELHEYIKSSYGEEKASKIHEQVNTIKFAEYSVKKVDEEIAKSLELMNGLGNDLRRDCDKLAQDIAFIAERSNKNLEFDTYIITLSHFCEAHFRAGDDNENYWPRCQEGINKIVVLNGENLKHKMSKEMDTKMQELSSKYRTLMTQRKSILKVLNGLLESQKRTYFRLTGKLYDAK